MRAELFYESTANEAVSKLGPRKHHFILAVLAGLCASYIFFTSQWGFGTSPDSIFYIAGARSLAAGQGFSFPSPTGVAAPIVQFPPLFSVVLSVFHPIGIDALDAASIVNAVLFGLNIYLAGLFVYRASKMPVAGYIAAGLTLTAPAILVTHAMVWSEALFLFLLLISAFAIARYRRMPNHLFPFAIFPGVVLAPLVRYAGIAVLVAAVFTIAKKNVRHALTLLGCALAVAGLWLVRNYLMTHNLTNRSIGFHPPTAEQLNLAWQTVIEWFGGLLPAVVVGGLAIVTVLRSEWSDKKPSAATFLMHFSIAYVAVLSLSLIFADAQTPLDRRILSPLYLSVSLWAVIWLASNAAASLRYVWAALAVLITALNASTSLAWLHRLSTQGVGFSSIFWRSSATVNYLKDHRIERLHTNAPDVVFLLTGMPAVMLPRHVDPGTRVENPEYLSQIKELKKNGGSVAYFRALTWRSYLPSEERLRDELGLTLIAELDDGAVYAIPRSSR